MATQARRDYYAILGVSRDADRDAIRRAFRSLASEHHPDVSGDPNTADRFRELAEAYEILSRPDTRERYDRYGFDPRGLGGFAPRPGSAFGLFDDLLDFATTFPRPGKRGADVLVEAEVEFVEAARGTTRGLRFTASALCPKCKGEGGRAGSLRIACPDCNGRGRIREGGDAGRPFRLRICLSCRGRGKRLESPCLECSGTGRIDEARSLLVGIPPATSDGQQIRLEGEGHAGGPGGEPGDVVVTVRVRPVPDSPLVRRLAVAGAVCGLGLLLFIALH